jgi:hypothetical protein
MTLNLRLIPNDLRHFSLFRTNQSIGQFEKDIGNENNIRGPVEVADGFFSDICYEQAR